MNKIKIADSPDGKPNYIIKQRKLGSRGGKGKNVIVAEVEAGANSCVRSVEQFLIDNKLMPFGGFVQFNR